MNAALLTLMLGQRMGDVLKLYIENVYWLQGHVVVQFKEGKTIPRMKPYSLMVQADSETGNLLTKISVEAQSQGKRDSGMRDSFTKRVFTDWRPCPCRAAALCSQSPAKHSLMVQADSKTGNLLTKISIEAQSQGKVRGRIFPETSEELFKKQFTKNRYPRAETNGTDSDGSSRGDREPTLDGVPSCIQGNVEPVPESRNVQHPRIEGFCSARDCHGKYSYATYLQAMRGHRNHGIQELIDRETKIGPYTSRRRR